MIYLKLINHEYEYELSDIIKMFYGKENIVLIKNEALDSNQSFFLVSGIYEEDNKIRIESKSIRDGIVEFEHFEIIESKSDISIKKIKNLVKKSMYELLSKKLGKTFPWGILTGIRPVKLVHELMDKGANHNEILMTMKEKYLVTNSRIEMAIKIAEIERKYIYPIDRKKVSVYIGIPFCPSRCFYCSFTSNPITKYISSVDKFISSLISEMQLVSHYMKEKNISVESLYIGGGTPTSINETQLATLLAAIKECFGNNFSEYTCEAGRPDTITEEKFLLLKKAGVTRLSINPQSMNDETLERIGRAHSVAQVIDSFGLAKKIGFDNINMDIIIGLPGEEKSHLVTTLEKIAELSPESITVHTMSVKRASILNENYDSAMHKENQAEEMMEYARDYIEKMDMQPYYLYRQKHMLNNLENIGFCRDGFECIYNMQIIEEKQSNIAFGADAVTKVVFSEENRIERQHNIKDLKLYIENSEKMAEKKILLMKQIYDNN